MARLAKIAAAGLAAAALGFAVAACQPQMMAPRALDAAAPANAMTVAEVQELVVGKTILVRDENRKVSRAEYFSPDGTVKLKAKLDSFAMLFSYKGKYYTAYAHGSGRESLPPDVEVEVRAGERVECSLIRSCRRSHHMKQVPDSLLAFQHMFPDDDACAAWLIEMRWPDGFVCPACGHEKGWALRRKAHTFECAGCRRQTSVTAGTILHASKLPLTVWFWAAYLMATHSNGISALQLQKQLGIGSYRSAWLLAHKLRASMVAPERNPLSGLVEIDEASLPFRTKDEPPTGGQGRSHDGKMLIVGAIELGDGNIPGRLRLAEISSYGAADLGHFVETAADPDAIAKTDGWSGYAAVPADRHNVHVVGKTAAHLVLPWIHQVFSNLKGWARGVYHGLRRKHLQAYLDEFVFRFNRRKTRHAAFRSLFRLATNAEPLTYSMLIEPEPCA